MVKVSVQALNGLFRKPARPVSIKQMNEATKRRACGDFPYAVDPRPKTGSTKKK
jgi:hypothetical protein